MNTLPKKSTQSLISAVNLTCIREDRLLFNDLSFEINPCDIVQVEGPNGAGKTSLLRILAGLSQPYDGHVYYQKKKITQCREEFQQNLLYFGHLSGIKGEMTAEENLRFNLALHASSPDNCASYLAKMNLLGFEDSLASHLSAGQHRRIALARLYQSNAPVWILDEPFTAIDKQGVDSLEHLFCQHAARGGCVILTTHQDIMSIKPDQLKKISLDYSYEVNGV
ncbi:cytochrome c biogenesis heme-transporting ATPase CcmA [Colwelliaceae bacterium MEBiC 14330]